MKNIGEAILDEIIKQGMVTPAENTVLVWSQNTTDQLSALVHDRMRTFLEWADANKTRYTSIKEAFDLYLYDE